MPQNGGNASVLVFLLIPLLLIGWMMWTTSKRQKALAKFQSELSVGRRVVTTSGLFGTITALGDATASLEIAPGVVVDFDRRAVGMLAEEVLPSDATAEKVEQDGESAPATDTDGRQEDNHGA